MVMEDWEEKVKDLIFYHFDDDEDFFFEKANSMLSTTNPHEILYHISSLKSIGNECFKGKNFLDASENYEFAIKLCSLFLPIIVEEKPVNLEEKSSFIDLVLAINLNLAACFMKSSDYVRVGQICSLILQFDEHNVKALYRRAMAALELNKPDLAYIDLTKAFEVDSANQEVVNKLFQIERQLGLPLGGKRKFEKSTTFETEQRGKKVFCTGDTIRNSPTLVVEELTPQGSEQMSDNLKKVNSDKNDALASTNLSDGDGLVGSSFTSYPSSCSSAEVSHCVPSLSSVIESPHLAEPKFRFSNRRRQGSSIQLSSSTYNQLLNGKEICFANGSNACVLKVRVLDHSKQDKEGVMSNSSSMAIVTGADATEEVYESKAEQLSPQNLFQFALPMVKSRRVHDIRKRQLKRRQCRNGGSRKGKAQFSSNKVCVCRWSSHVVQYERGKRKYVPLFSEVFSFSHRSLKRRCVFSRSSRVLPIEDNSFSAKSVVDSESLTIYQRMVGMSSQGMEGTLDGELDLQGVASEQVFRYFGDTELGIGEKVEWSAGMGGRCVGGSDVTDSLESHTQSVQESSSRCSQACSEDVNPCALYV